MPVNNPPGTLRITLLILGAFAFLCFEWNLHCTQNTSFFTAVFDMEVHPEDNGFGGAAPLVYRQSFAWPVRVVLAAALLVALLGPASERGEPHDLPEPDATPGRLPSDTHRDHR